MQLKGLCLTALLFHGVIASPSGAGQRHKKTATRKLHGRFLHITDLHPDEFYKVHASTEEDDACHHGKGPAGLYGAETSDCDSPFALVNATFDWIAANLKDDIDFVIWTGDSARHDSDEQLPRSPSQVLGTNRWIADKFADLFSDPISRNLAVPVVPTFGNNDILPHNILLPGPNKWLRYYTDIWRHFIPEEQRHSFDFGGWFYVEVVPNQLAVFSLNTLYFFDRNAGVDDCAHPSEPGFKQMEWLRVQLQFLRQRGMKAILMGHVPPARTDSKMLWDETCWQKYTLWLKQYRDVVVGGLYGHMNIDHFLLQDTKEIDMDLLVPMDDEERVSVREAMEDELSIQSTADYLQELRDDWSKLPKPAVPGEEAHGNGKKKKLGRWAERYQLSLISPSVVPNYYPTLRVFEYNITGLEDNPVWADVFGAPADTSAALFVEAGDQKVLDLRDVPIAEIDPKKKKKKHSKSPKEDDKEEGSGKKGKKPKDPNFTIPDGPSKSSPPGPAYSMQPLTLTGFTQLYANLTHINNDMTPDDEEGSNSWTNWLQRWREGKHGGKQPKSKEPNPREFQFEVEYSTFDDKTYKLADLTVNSFVDLAYRMGQDDPKGKGTALAEPEQDDDDDDPELTSDDIVEGSEKGKGGKKGKGGNNKGNSKKGKENKIWLHFLKHAFVSTVPKKDLKNIAS